MAIAVPPDVKEAYEKVSPYHPAKSTVLFEQAAIRELLHEITSVNRSDARIYGTHLARIVGNTPGVTSPRNVSIPPPSLSIPPLSPELGQYWEQTIAQGREPFIHECFKQQYARIPLALIRGVSLVEHETNDDRYRISNDADENYWVCDVRISDDPAYDPGDEFRKATAVEAACIFAEFPQFGSARGTCPGPFRDETLQVFFASSLWDAALQPDVRQGQLIADSFNPIINGLNAPRPKNHHMVWVRNLDGRKAPPVQVKKMNN